LTANVPDRLLKLSDTIAPLRLLDWHCPRPLLSCVHPTSLFIKRRIHTHGPANLYG
jgi:hypothetical protein